MNELLRQLGFSGNEAKIYETLCKYKELTGQELAKKSGIDRSVTYNVLSNLAEKGVVGAIIKGNKRAFSITEPENLLREIKMKEDIAKEVIKEVKEKRQINNAETKVKIYNGVAASRKFYSLITEEKNTIFRTFGGDGSMLKRIGPYLEHFRKNIKGREVKMRLLAGKNYENLDLFLGVPFTEVIQTKSKKHSSSCSILGDHIVFHHYTNNPEIIMINNPEIANMMRDIFDTTWNIYPKENILHLGRRKKKTIK